MRVRVRARAQRRRVEEGISGARGAEIGAEQREQRIAAAAAATAAAPPRPREEVARAESE